MCLRMCEASPNCTVWSWHSYSNGPFVWRMWLFFVLGGKEHGCLGGGDEDEEGDNNHNNALSKFWGQVAPLQTLNANPLSTEKSCHLGIQKIYWNRAVHLLSNKKLAWACFNLREKPGGSSSLNSQLFWIWALGMNFSLDLFFLLVKDAQWTAGLPQCCFELRSYLWRSLPLLWSQCLLGRKLDQRAMT